MSPEAQPDLIIAGASARAAAFSAARAGFRPYWIDQFGDEDLRTFPGLRVEHSHYPAALAAALESAPDAPWLYTGALENHLDTMQRMQALRALAGNRADACRQVRDPSRLRESMLRAGLSSPELADAASPRAHAWLSKPLRGSGGIGVNFAQAGQGVPVDHYLQRFVPGENRSAVFMGDGRNAVLAGVTVQLIGRPEFHAGPFCYCGSIGPLEPDATEHDQWQRIGAALAQDFGLRGLFGVDAVLSEGRVFPVEVNPRYTASVEVLELASGMTLVRDHLRACTGELPRFRNAGAKTSGKAYLYAPSDLDVPRHERIHAVQAEGCFPRIADIPRPGSTIRAGAPVLTVLVRGDGIDACARLLAEQAREVYRILLQGQEQ